MTKKQKIHRAIFGSVFGWFSPYFLSLCISLLSMMFATRGSYEWEEDASFLWIPIILLAAYGISILAYILCHRKKIKHLVFVGIPFLGALLISGVRFHIGLSNNSIQCFSDFIKYSVFL